MYQGPFTHTSLSGIIFWGPDLITEVQRALRTHNECQKTPPVWVCFLMASESKRCADTGSFNALVVLWKKLVFVQNLMSVLRCFTAIAGLRAVHFWKIQRFCQKMFFCLGMQCSWNARYDPKLFVGRLECTFWLHLYVLLHDFCTQCAMTRTESR